MGCIFNVIIGSKENLDLTFLTKIKRVFYNNLEIYHIDRYKKLKEKISNYLRKDPQIDVMCSLLLNTYIKKMLTEYDNFEFTKMMLDYDMMIKFLSDKYKIIDSKVKIK